MSDIINMTITTPPAVNQSITGFGIKGDTGATGAQGPKGDAGDPATNLVASVAGKTGAVTLDKTDVGLSNVDNLAPADMPVSTAQQTALNAKANASDTVNLTGNQTVAGVKTFSSSPVVPTATTSTQAVNKAQMDAADALKVNKAGDTMSGSLRLTSSTNPDDYASFLYNGASNYSIFKIGNFRPTANNTINTIGFFSLNSAGSQSYHSAINAIMTDNTAGAVRSTVGIDRMENNVQINAFSANENRVLLGSNRVEFGGIANITGTGFPNGVVSAPVGSIYIDKAITNGASSWVKKSGTGNTGWQVLEGDTGWRDVSALIPPASTTGGILKIRRVLNRIYIQASNLYLTSTSEIALIANIGSDLGAEWRPIENVSSVVSINSSGVNTKFLNIRPTHSTLGLSHVGEITTRYWASGYDVISNWPSTLPGTAA